MLCIVLVGTPALTSRGFKENDFVQVVAFIDEAVQIASSVKAKTGNCHFLLLCHYWTVRLPVILASVSLPVLCTLH